MGGVQQGSTPTFGFTGEQQDGNLINLRARWYNATNGTFTGQDPFEGFAEQPYSLHPYQYGYNAPTNYTDPSGRSPACFAALVGNPVLVGGCLLVAGAIVGGYATYQAWQCAQRSCLVQPVQQIINTFSPPAVPLPSVSAGSVPPPAGPYTPPLIPQLHPGVVSSGGFTYGQV